jgi:chitinase
VSPYTFSWTGVAAGTYSVTAKAYDNLGATTTSSAVSVTVNPSTTCTAPVWSATTVYTAGNLVQYSGIKYQAAFWTQNQRPDLNNGPSGSGQPWISLGTCTSKIASLAETMQDVLVAPNPVDVNLSINFNLIEANEVDIYIIDQLGKRVQNVYQGSMAEGDYHYDVNTSSLVPGIYSVVLQGVNGEKSIRFVKK